MKVKTRFGNYSKYWGKGSWDFNLLPAFHVSKEPKCLVLYIVWAIWHAEIKFK